VIDMKVGAVKPLRGIGAGRLRRRPRLPSRPALSERIAGRYGSRRLAVPPLVAVLLRRQRPSPAIHILNVTAGIALHRHCWSRIQSTEGSELAAATTPISKSYRAAAAERHPLDQSPGAIERIAVREYRRDMFTTDRRSTVRHLVQQQTTHDVQPIWHINQPIEFVLRRSESAAEPRSERRGHGPAETEPIHTAARVVEAGGRHAAASTATIPLSPSELSRLTDDVVRAIDRRFTAHRERRGVI
jgi:hypothetical protein